MRRAVVVLGLVWASTAAAEPALKLEREPPRLRMRHRAAQAPDPKPERAVTPVAPSVSATSPEPIAGLEGVRDVRDPISFSVNIGYQVDAARPSGRRALGAPVGPIDPIANSNGILVRPGVDYERLRAYAFGEAFVSTRGIGLPSLSTYLSLRFQAARRLRIDRDQLEIYDGTIAHDRLAAPIATWFERSGPDPRTGWVELIDFLPKRWGLRRLRVRAGDQHVYGPWIVHLGPGVNVAYESPTLNAAIYSGLRRSEYTREQDENRPGVFGASARFDLRGLNQVPIAVAGEYLALSDSTATNQPASASAQLQLDWRPRRDVAVIGQVRGLSVDHAQWRMANQRFEVRVRYKDVTNFVFSGLRRNESDWRWDPTLVARQQDDLTEARRYLDLGPVLPQTLFSARAGTLIAENIDLYVRLAASSSSALQDGPTGDLAIVNTYAAPYLELGGALEIRLRRQVAFGLSLLSRASDRINPLERGIADNHDTIDPLPASASIGEDGFVEAGTRMRLTLGARKLSAMVELYGRQTNHAPTYEDAILPLPEEDRRGGGRFTVDAWVGRRVRLFVSYDVSSALDTAPEITGYQSVKMTFTGVY